ncbi:MAG: hypothetical protein MZV49_15190 [Rhodopseudomonas palustris]|nr:hypothetical protein [Rhodopseudomonas palustris]
MQLLRAWGAAGEATIEGRRKRLSTILFS